MENKKAQDYLEPFSYESESRSFVEYWRASTFMREPFSTKLNDFQLQSWVVWNQLEDEKIATKTEWSRLFL